MADETTPTPPAGTPAVGGGGASSGPSRQELRQQSSAGGRRGPGAWLYILIAVGVLLIAGVVALIATSGNKTASVAPPAPVKATTTTAPAPVCPLTGEPAPNGTVPARPALGIKIGNYPGDRPSAGLNQADIVFEEPVEGAITRLLAVFHCQSPSLVGDIRSARQPDAGIMAQLSNPLLVHAGGIDPVIALLKASPLIDENLYSGGNGSAILMQPGRQAPYSTFVNTSTLWALDPSDTTPPAPIFQYTAAPPAGTVAGSGASVHIPFSATSDVTWTWSPSTGTYLRSYSGQPDILIGGAQTAATNVVVMTVQTANGTWVENEEGGHEVLVTSTGAGPLVVLRDGAAISGTWSRPSLTSPATLTSSGGTAITLHPGNTWVELVPAGVTVTPAAATPAAATSSSTTTTTTP